MPTLQLRADLVDEYGELCRQIAERAPAIARQKALAATIQTWYADAPAEQAYVEPGQRYSVQVSPRKKESSISLGRVYKLIGKVRFLQAARFTLSDLNALVSTEEQARLALVATAATGSRTLTAVAQAPAVAA